MCIFVEPSAITMVTQDHPFNPSLPDPPRKSGVKRKSRDLTASCDSNYAPAIKQKRVCARLLAPKVLDPLLLLREELHWMREQESKPCMWIDRWPEGGYLRQACDVTKQQHADVIEWLMMIHMGLHLEKNALFVAVNLLDRCYINTLP